MLTTGWVLASKRESEWCMRESRERGGGEKER
jgi:hypothetical protein